MIEAFYDSEPQVFVLKMSHKFIINYNYLIVDSVNNLSVIVDPAWEIEKIEHILTHTETSLKGILLTHSHPDHIDLAIPLSLKYNCPIWMSNTEIATSCFTAKHLNGIDITPWSIGQLQIQPIFTPGHSQGSTCYLIGNSLFTGDTLFAEGCGLCPDIISAQTMYSSIKLLKEVIKPETYVFPGHSYGKIPGQKFSLLLKENIYLQFNNQEDFVAYRMRKGQKAAKLFNFQ